MKLYLCTWGTNYGLDCCIVSALTEESAKQLALADRAWPDTLEANEIKSSDKEEVLKINFYNNYGG